MKLPATTGSDVPPSEAKLACKLHSHGSTILVVILGVFLVTLSLFGLWSVRERGMAAFDNPKARQEWDGWRDAVASGKAGDSSVKRRIPKSPEPPTLVLLRDHFLVCASLLVVTEAALFATIAFMVIGALRKKQHESV
jgi:hypothetical protein